MRALLPVLVAGAALLAAAPASAEYVCDTLDTSRVEAGGCVRVLESEREYACVSTRVDPVQSTDDTTTGFVCVIDIGNGPEVYSCVVAGRRPILCGR